MKAAQVLSREYFALKGLAVSRCRQAKPQRQNRYSDGLFARNRMRQAYAFGSLGEGGWPAADGISSTGSVA
jgi:hypothetical protein